ncbi:MAG: CoA pyrophosphatase [Candidatus Puniceispirillaceae bacterium]
MSDNHVITDKGITDKGLALFDAPVPIALPDGVRPAAVLIGLSNDDAPSVILTRRSVHLKKHAGQISFPGGRVDDEDADFIATALRESEEEIGLAKQDVTVLGYRPDLFTGTGFRITPVVGKVHLSAEQLAAHLTAAPDEVDDILLVPFERLANLSHYSQFTRQDGAQTWKSWRIMAGEHVIWGATAAILHDWASALS